MGATSGEPLEERSRSSLSNVLQPFCTACAAKVSKRVSDLGRSPDGIRGLAHPPARRGSREKKGLLLTPTAKAGGDAPKPRSKLFSPSEWLATAASSAIEEPLARAVRVKVARLGGKTKGTSL